MMNYNIPYIYQNSSFFHSHSFKYPIQKKELFKRIFLYYTQIFFLLIIFFSIIFLFTFNLSNKYFLIPQNFCLEDTIRESYIYQRKIHYSLFVFILFCGFVFSVISIVDYKNKIRLEVSSSNNIHRLNFNEVFDNNNRQKIIEEILNEPGIHYNELRRKCQLNAGQLQWHLNVLENFGIIFSEKIGQYLVYRVRGDYWEDDLILLKSSTSNEVLNLVKENPGINTSEIARNLNLRRNSIKYHIDKLLDKNLIYSIRKGRKVELFFNNDE